MVEGSSFKMLANGLRIGDVAGLQPKDSIDFLMLNLAQMFNLALQPPLRQTCVPVAQLHPPNLTIKRQECEILYM